jgi:PAS domain S-box-containing protein
MGEHNLPQTSVDLHDLDNRHVESGIRALADSLGEGLVVIQHNRVEFINEKLLEILDMPRSSVLGESLNELLPEDHESWDYIDIRVRRERGESISYPEEIRLRLKSGRTAVLRNRATLIQWQGEPATVHFLEDITHRKAMENQLLQQKEVNAILADAVRRILASPLSLKDTAAAVLDSAMRLTGSRSGVLLIDDAGRQVLSERRCEGQCLHCIVPEVMRHIESDEVLMNHRRPGRIPGAFYLNEGLERAKDCLIGGQIRNILRVPARNESTVSGQIILADTPTSFGPWDLDNMEKIAEVLNLALLRVQTIAELENAKITAEKEADAKSLFLANVSHEIRSPLNGVLMMASLLRDSDLSEEQKELLGVVMFSAQTIDRLIRDLTDLTQIRTGKFTVHNDTFDFSELVRHLVDINRPEATRKGLELVSDIGPKLDYLYGDRERIGQIIANLLINAVKYTDRGHVRMDAVEEDGNLVISVEDTGIGIPEGQQQAVFNLFHPGPAR